MNDRWNKIEKLYYAALERPENERVPFLQEACDGDEPLRREVESLLAQESSGNGLLDRPVLELAKEMMDRDRGESMIGQRLGGYEIQSLLGAGGMGEVYKARDSKLRRDVAIKVIPSPFAQDPERVARFRREAQLLASLNHPNIAAIYGLEELNGTTCLVMELVLGDTLSERISRKGAVPVEEALNIAKQIAEALEAAHERGIVHRDLKPANVKVTPDSKVKVLDFGLAKAYGGDGIEQNDSEATTVITAGTRPGMIMGTPSYMSPEQASGNSLDKRTDIWAFGCVFYELLTGKQAFAGTNVTEILGAVLHKEPDWSALPPATPPAIRTLVRRCLQKHARERFRDAGDIRIQIEESRTAESQWVKDGGGQSAPAISVATTWKRRFVFSTVGLLALAATALLVWNLRAPVPPPVTRLALTLPPGQHLTALDQPAIAISPDGKDIVYVAVQENQSPDRKGGVPASGEQPIPRGRGSDTGTQQLFLRPLDNNEAKPIAGTEGAVSPFYSPDGQWIGFFADGKLKKVSVNGGAAVTMANAPQPVGASWSSQGTLALQGTSMTGQVLQQVSQEGDALQPLTRLGKGENYQGWPEFLPNGQGVLFAGSQTYLIWNNAQIEVQQPPGEGKNLAQGTQPRYAASGHLLYAQSGTLMAVPFDARRLALSGAAVPVIEGMLQSNTGAAQYSVSSTGTLVYLAGGVAASQSRLVWVSRNGEEQTLPAVPHNYQFPRVSPDGRRVAVGIDEQETQMWVYEVSRDTLTRLTFEGNNNSLPAWSPDGKRIAFWSNQAGPTNLFWQSADGSGGAERLTTSDYADAPNSFSPDGQLLAYIENNPQTGRDIWVLNLKDRKAQPFLKTPHEDAAPKFSPDGKWLAYSSDESGRREIYVQLYPGPGGKWQISAEGGQEPVWNPKGGELFYRSGNKIMAVDVDTKSSFSPGKPRMLFEGPYLPTTGSFPFYDVSPDGQRFLMLKPVESQTSAPTQINVVLNWFEELKLKVPTAK